MNIGALLTRCGCTDHESRVYEYLVEHGTATGIEIARGIGLHRAQLYLALKSLHGRNLIAQSMRGKRRVYSARDTQPLYDAESEKMRELQDAAPYIRALLTTHTGSAPRIHFYEGVHGIKQINEDTLTAHKEIVGYTTPLFMSAQQKVMGRDFIARRVAKKIRSRVIGEDCYEVRELAARDMAELRQTRIVSRDLFITGVEVVMYDAKVAIVDYRKEWGVIIDNEEIAKTMRMLFELVWSRWDK